mmetsp:Transcript_78076/g.181119  ORF Transcript_78076/g.181119 Transcript_78076/m.181119 type:complete len:293 (+) Transcript_78076:1030-1908(+)
MRQRVDGCHHVLFHPLFIRPHLSLRPFLPVVLLPHTFKVGANDTNRQRNDTEAPDEANTCGHLPRCRRGVHVTVAGSCGCHQCPPERMWNRLERALLPLHLIALGLSEEDPKGRPCVALSHRVVGSLFNKEHDSSEDDHADGHVQHEDPDCACGTLHGAGDNDHRLEPPSQPEGTHDAHEANELQHDHGAVPTAVLLLLVRHAPRHVGGQYSCQVDEVGECTHEVPYSPKPGGPADHLVCAHDLDDVLLVQDRQLHAHASCGNEACEVLYCEEHNANSVNDSKLWEVVWFAH